MQCKHFIRPKWIKRKLIYHKREPKHTVNRQRSGHLEIAIESGIQNMRPRIKGQKPKKKKPQNKYIVKADMETLNITLHQKYQSIYK